MSELRVRAPRKEDAERLAEIHLENCRYYCELDPDTFQVPQEEGLVEWFRSFLAAGQPEDELTLVADLDGEVAGYLEARIEQPLESAEHQLTRELAEKRLFVNHVGVARRHWRSGVGAALMDAVEQWGRQRGATIAALDTYHSRASSGGSFLSSHRESGVDPPLLRRVPSGLSRLPFVSPAFVDNESR